jgi:hypothetical protein
MERFKGGPTSVNDVHSGLPLTCIEAKEQIYQRIRDNQRIRTDQIACGEVRPKA